jgi:hypothetical protein
VLGGKYEEPETPTRPARKASVLHSSPLHLLLRHHNEKKDEILQNHGGWDMKTEESGHIKSEPRRVTHLRRLYDQSGSVSAPFLPVFDKRRDTVADLAMPMVLSNTTRQSAVVPKCIDHGSNAVVDDKAQKVRGTRLYRFLRKASDPKPYNYWENKRRDSPVRNKIGLFESLSQSATSLLTLPSRHKSSGVTTDSSLRSRGHRLGKVFNSWRIGRGVNIRFKLSVEGGSSSRTTSDDRAPSIRLEAATGPSDTDAVYRQKLKHHRRDQGSYKSPRGRHSRSSGQSTFLVRGTGTIVGKVMDDPGKRSRTGSSSPFPCPSFSSSSPVQDVIGKEARSWYNINSIVRRYNLHDTAQRRRPSPDNREERLAHHNDNRQELPVSWREVGDGTVEESEMSTMLVAQARCGLVCPQPSRGVDLQQMESICRASTKGRREPAARL